MRRKYALALLTTVVGIGVVTYLGWANRPGLTSDPSMDAPSTSLSKERGRYLFMVSLHTPEEIAGLLTRAEELARTQRANNNGSGIALVLHGPEIEIFAKKNYAQFQKTVDQAARLDAARIIEVKMCRTEMKILGIQEQDVPGFIELVPYGPDEEARLRRDGYVYL